MQARVHYAASLALYQTLGAEAMVGVVVYAASPAVNRMLGAEALTGVVLGDLANVARLRGDLTEAGERWQEALAIVRRFIKNKWAAGWALANIGTLLEQQGDHRGAAWLIGAATTTHAVFWTSIDPDEREACETAQAAARGALGEAAYAAAWVEGQALSVERALALVLERLGGGLRPGDR